MIILLLSCINLVNLHVIVYSACYVTYNRASTVFVTKVCKHSMITCLLSVCYTSYSVQKL